MNSRAKGKRGELDLIRRHLIEHFPEASRNLDQFAEDKRDCLGVGDYHVQVKFTESLRIWDAIKQAEAEAMFGRIPIVAFRRSRSPWYINARADFLVPLLAQHGGSDV